MLALLLEQVVDEGGGLVDGTGELGRLVDEDVHVVRYRRADFGREDRGRDRPDLTVELGDVLDRLGGACQRRAFKVAVGLDLSEDGYQLRSECVGIHGHLLHPADGKIFLHTQRVKPRAPGQRRTEWQATRREAELLGAKGAQQARTEEPRNMMKQYSLHL